MSAATPHTAMVLAAGLGTRMRPLTNDRPKAMVEVGGKALIDHMLDRLGEAGVERAVVNVHHFGDLLEAHLASRTVAPRVEISDERAQLLDSGGGIKHAHDLLGEDTAFIANIDSVWTEDGAPALASMVQAWDPTAMDCLLLLARMEETLGFDGPGDFFMDEGGRLTHRGTAPRAPYAFIGVQILKPGVIYAVPDEKFSIFPLWMRMAAEGRLRGVVLDGFWMHVGDPAARDAAEARLR
ncbi:MAG: nucleotidyltransferase family protein [Caulobacterales bacterium]|nr:nucleotidyltransferase family protein [Caulobacterales bacterium]